MAADAVVRCPACARKIKFRSEHAGKKMRCSCAAVVRMPADPSQPVELLAQASPAPPPAPAPTPAAPAGSGSNHNPIVPTGQSYELDDSMFNGPVTAVATATSSTGEARCPQCGSKVKPGAVLCLNCGHHFQTGKKITTTVGEATDHDAAPAPAPAGLRGNALVNAQAAAVATRYRHADEDAADIEKKHRTQNLYVPLGLSLLGLAGMIFRAFYFMPFYITRPGWYVATFVSVPLVVQLPFLLLALFLTARIMSTSFGPLLPAIFKLLALAMFTLGVGGTIGDFINVATMGLGSLYITPTLRYGIFWGLSVYLFETDYLETTVLYLLSSFIPAIAIFFALAYLQSMLGNP